MFFGQEFIFIFFCLTVLKQDKYINMPKCINIYAMIQHIYIWISTNVDILLHI